MAKQMAKAKNPFIATRSSSNVCGTSSETTSRVTAKANTASVKPSSRVISPPRQRKCGSGGTRCAPVRLVKTWPLLCHSIHYCGRRSFTPQLAFPASNHGACQAVAQNVGCRSRHVHELVNAKNQQHRPGRQVERIERAQQDHKHRARNAGHAFACKHKGENHDQLLAER